MDDIVRQALAKWPRVPHCFGWLGLDARGGWYLRDDRAQAAGPFAGGAPLSKGSLLRHDKLIEFIQRNYEADELGQWFFQNGPQRVYVELEATPLIWRVHPDLALVSHTGEKDSAREVFVDELGRVYALGRIGFGLIHTQDVTHVADAVESGSWTPQNVLADDLPSRFGYRRSPAALQKK